MHQIQDANPRVHNLVGYVVAPHCVPCNAHPVEQTNVKVYARNAIVEECAIFNNDVFFVMALHEEATADGSIAIVIVGGDTG